MREIQTTYVFTRNPIRDTGSAPGSALRPGRCSRHFSILRRKDFFYFLRRIITLSNLKQCSGDNPHHIVEKTVSSDPEADQIVFFFQTRFIDRRTVSVTSGFAVAKLLKSCMPTRYDAACRIASTSSGRTRNRNSVSASDLQRCGSKSCIHMF